jgi:hypothetical protein
MKNYPKLTFLERHGDIMKLMWEIAPDMATLEGVYHANSYSRAIKNMIKVTHQVEAIKQELRLIYREFSKESKRDTKQPYKNRNNGST